MVLMGNFAGEAIRTPELLGILREHAVEPRVTLVENVLAQLQGSGAVRRSFRYCGRRSRSRRCARPGNDDRAQPFGAPIRALRV
jgi:hypothetical protein